MIDLNAVKPLIEPVAALIVKEIVEGIKDALRSDDPSKITYAIKRSTDSENTEELMNEINEILKIDL